MTDADAFLQTILNNPDDDTARLVFADWLEETGEIDRAEFIRVQCERASLSPDDPRWTELGQRETALLKKHRPKWLEPIQQVLDPDQQSGRVRRVLRRLFFREVGIPLTWHLQHGVEFRRGFVARLSLPSAAFILYGERLMQLAPIQTMYLDADEEAGGVEGLRDCLALGRLAPLLVASLWLDPVIQELVHAQHRDWLSELSLSGHLHPAAMRRLAGSSLLRQLRRLELCGPNDARAPRFAFLDAGSVQELASGRHSANLAELAVLGNRINDEGVAALSLANRLAGLTCLDLAHNPISDRGALALSRSSAFPLLGVLNLAHNHITDTGAVALARSPNLGELSRLYLQRNPIREHGKQALRERFGERVQF